MARVSVNRRPPAEPVVEPEAEAPDPRDLTAMDEALRAVVELAAEPLTESSTDDPEGPEGASEGLADPIPEEVAELVVAAAADPALMAALEALRDTHLQTSGAIRDLLVASIPPSARGHDAREEQALVTTALGVLEKFAMRPEPPQPNVHVHVPKQDMTFHIDQPDFNPEIHVDAPVLPDPAPIQVDVHVPEQPAPHVHVAAAAAPDVVVQPGPPANVVVHMPDHLHVIPAETETIAERDADDLIVRSVTRPTTQQEA